MSKEALLRALMQGMDDKNDSTPSLKGEELAVELRKRLQLYAAQHDFRPGMLVRQKPGLTIYKHPKPGSAAIVVNVFEPEPIFNAEHFGGTKYGAQADLAIGFIDGDDDFMVIRVDSRRMEPID